MGYKVCQGNRKNVIQWISDVREFV